MKFFYSEAEKQVIWEVAHEEHVSAEKLTEAYERTMESNFRQDLYDVSHENYDEIMLPKSDTYYEITILMREDIGDEGMKMAEALVKGAGYEVVKTEDDGVKRLAYSIKGHEKARYLFIEARGESKQAVLLSKMLDTLSHNDDTLLRYLVVIESPKAVAVKHGKGE